MSLEGFLGAENCLALIFVCVMFGDLVIPRELLLTLWKLHRLKVERWYRLSFGETVLLAFM